MLSQLQIALLCVYYIIVMPVTVYNNVHCQHSELFPRHCSMIVCSVYPYLKKCLWSIKKTALKIDIKCSILNNSDYLIYLRFYCSRIILNTYYTIAYTRSFPISHVSVIRRWEEFITSDLLFIYTFYGVLWTSAHKNIYNIF